MPGSSRSVDAEEQEIVLRVKVQVNPKHSSPTRGFLLGVLFSAACILAFFMVVRAIRLVAAARPPERHPAALSAVPQTEPGAVGTNEDSWLLNLDKSRR